jgi:peptide/nickel transport system substrate-binding protein
MQGRREFIKVAGGAAGLTAFGRFRGRADAQGAPRVGGTARVALSTNFDDPDPHKYRSITNFNLFTLCTEGLTDVGKHFEVQPCLAESWQVSPNGLDYLFTLRKGVKFHNGQPLTSGDVKTSLERIMNPKTASAQRSDFALVQTITAVDPQRLRITLKQPFAPFLTKVATARVPILAASSLSAEGSVSRVVGTGPWELVEWKTNEFVRLKRFKEYREQGLPYIDEVIVKPIADGNTRLAGLRAGDLDFIQEVPYKDIDSLRSARNIVAHTGPGSFPSYIVFNCRKPPFDDVRVRQAVAHAVDKKALINGHLWGHAQVAGQPFPNGSPWRLDVKEREVDLDKARRLMAEAGHAGGFEIPILISTGWAEFVEGAQVLQSQLKKIGINLKLDVTDLATWVARVNKRDFNLFYLWYSARYDPDDFYRRMFHSSEESSNNRAGYHTAALDALLDQGATTREVAERKRIYTKVLQIAIDEAPLIWTSIPDISLGWSTALKGFETNIGGYLVYAGGGLQRAWLER